MQFYTLLTEQCLSLLEQRLREEGSNVTFTEEQRHDVKDVFSILRRSPEWANGRDINMVTNDLIGDAYENGACDNYLPVVTFADILQCLKTRIPQRLRRLGTSPSRLSSSSQLSADEAVTVSDPPAIVVDAAPSEGKQADGLSETGHDANQGVFAKDVTASKIADEVIELSDSPVPESRSRYSYARLPKGRYTRVVLLQPARDHREPLQIKLERLALEGDPGL